MIIWLVASASLKSHLLLLVCFVSMCATAYRPSPGCNLAENSSVDANALKDININVDSVSRRFLWYIPPAHNGSGDALPLVLNFHGTPSTADDQLYYTGMDITAEKYGFHLAFPDGFKKAFNAGGCCARHDLDDESFSRATVDYIADNACVDLDRVFATGWSNGGYMSYYLACKASDYFQAIAPVGGLIGVDPYSSIDCDPSNPPRVLHFHETQDPDVDYCGPYPEYMGAEDLVAAFAIKQGCDADALGISYERGEVVCRSHRNCTNNGNATLCSIARSYRSHSWPGATSNYAAEDGTKDIEANEAIWAFFSQAIPNDDTANLVDDFPNSETCHDSRALAARMSPVVPLVMAAVTAVCLGSHCS